MLAPRELPAEYKRWNGEWGAPHGYRHAWRRALLRVAPDRLSPYLAGPFGFQADNSETRTFEYPWAFAVTPLTDGMTAVDVGGSTAGLQFVLAKHGLRVVNVDPGDTAAMGWPLDQRVFARLNRAFRTDVELRRCFLEEADFAPGSVDRVFTISTLEHIPSEGVDRLTAEAARILRPGGSWVVTIDLFLDLAPFTPKTTNRSGRNLDVARLVEASGLELRVGDRSELNGFPEFDRSTIQAGLSDYLYGARVPALAQCLVLTKPGPLGGPR